MLFLINVDKLYQQNNQSPTLLFVACIVSNTKIFQEIVSL